jgi:predicted enzyme related to lactoylglutathione lyase
MHSQSCSRAPHARAHSHLVKRRVPLLLAAMLSVAYGAALAAPPQLPAINDPATHEHHVGKVVLVELVTPDLDASKRFYSGLFGWTFRDSSAGKLEYSQAMLDGRSVAGLVHKDLPAGDQRKPSWLTFISVSDVDAAKNAAVAKGAKVLFEPHMLPARGKEAVLADPQGAVFAVLASSSGDAADELASPGEWIWSSLITSDVDAGAAFYQTLFNYEVYPVDDDGDGDSDHAVFASENYARASANSLPEKRPDARAHWINFVRVDDVDQAVAKVTQLGGRVVVDPRPDRQGGKVAVAVDPQGAHFGLMEWSDSGKDKEVTP